MSVPKPLLVLGFAIVALLAYSSALQADFIWDDDSYVTENPNLTEPGGLARIWFEPLSNPQYYPLVFTTFWIEGQLWGLKPFGYHLVNVLLHTMSALLLWRVLTRLRAPGALFAAAVFLLHPVCVESVAWITERKNVLALLFFLASALAYLRFRPLDDDEEGPGGGIGPWIAAFLFFACALLSKTVSASLPAALLLVTWWRRGRIGMRDVLPLVPFFVIGVGMGLYTIHLETDHVGAVGEEWTLTTIERAGVIARVPWFYLQKIVWPAPLAFFYPRWESMSVAVTALLGAATVALLIGLFVARGRIGRGPLTAILFFGGVLVPASGLFDVYPFRFSYVADHFQYVAMLGPIALIAAIAASIDHPLWVRIRPIAAFVVLGTFGFLTWQQGKVYENLETLWRDTIEKNPDGWAAYTSLGLLCVEDGRRAEGEALIEKGFERSSFVTEAWSSMAYLHFEHGRVDEALDLYRSILERSSNFAQVVTGIALEAANQGRLQDGARLLELAVRATPDSAAAHFALGSVRAQSGRFPEARQHFEAAVRLDSEHVDAHVSLGRLYAQEGRREEAIGLLRRALQLQPGHPTAQAYLDRLTSGG